MEISGDLSFEQAIARLEEIVRALEDGETTLNASLSLFEEGVTLARQCSQQLTDAQGKLESLVQKPDGAVEILPLEDV